MEFTFLAALFCTVAAAVAFGMAGLLPLLKGRAILDHPNERSSHEAPTPKGGGIVLAIVICSAWVTLGLYFESGPFFYAVLPGVALGLAALSWLDDLRGLPPLARLLAQIVAVAAILALRPESTPYFQELLPGVLDPVAAAILWVWFINLFNFMDGIDGITAIETLVIGFGIALISIDTSGVFALIIAAAALGFLKWNWHPAKIFLGDVGSVPLGFLLGWLLLDMAAAGQWAAALILPAYYLADATITLIKRAIKGEKVWQAHRQHFYQQAVQRGLSHSKVSTLVLALGVVLIVLAWVAEQGFALPALVAAAVLSLAFLRYLAGSARG